jgi:F0F1-type ATP synthase membrane subunit b/b'
MDILGILGKIGFDWQVALANLVNFLIIFWILKKFAFKPVREILQKDRM